MTITEKSAARYGTAAPPATPLILEIPLRGGKFTAQIRIPLNVTEGELGFISKTIMNQPALKDSWRLEPHEYIVDSPPYERLSKQTRERIEKGRAKHSNPPVPTIAPATADLHADGWRCHAPVAEDAECMNPKCIQLREEAEDRMGMHRQVISAKDDIARDRARRNAR